ncbi:acid phosphatase 1 [Prunus yedoensis var. nudiflora]|uniref:Acid phosphatase 1 n=1 Tax=Prunus yedoensis var. nudiflora TaxID=2094558 RepID=A0A314YXC0_PRUYE|nr:acid phosphatase 1 [Prunus yedoensis var. nudiflora]
MVQRTQEVFILVYLTLFSKATGLKPYPKPSLPQVEGAAFLFELETGCGGRQCACMAHGANSVSALR